MHIDDEKMSSDYCSIIILYFEQEEYDRLERVRRATIDVFVMGLHPRAGVGSRISDLDIGVVGIITGFV